MNEIEYKPTKVKKYELTIWESGNCKSLADINIFDGNVVWNYSGCTNIKDFVKAERRDGIYDGISKYLCAIRKIVEGFRLAEEYVITPNDISLDSERLWFDAESQNVKLLPFHEAGEFIDRLCGMLRLIGGGEIADKIEIMNKESAWSYNELLSFLSSYELELR